MDIRQKLFSLSDPSYAAFVSSLNPTVDPKTVIGVRVPLLRELAKKLYREKDFADFLSDLPHRYFDENMLHIMILNEIRDYDVCIRKTEDFLPFVDNWAVCDSLSPKCFSRNREDLLIRINRWIVSDEIYTCRFAIKNLMTHFLGENFSCVYHELVCSVASDDYYIRMMKAWYFATAIAKNWDESIILLEGNRLDRWVHNKTIQKARESFRITEEQKSYLKTLRRP